MFNETAADILMQQMEADDSTAAGGRHFSVMRTPLVKILTAVSHWLLILNSSCNIAIYLHKDPKFKSVLKAMLLSLYGRLTGRLGLEVALGRLRRNTSRDVDIENETLGRALHATTANNARGNGDGGVDADGNGVEGIVAKDNNNQSVGA